jgi:hypothetical protein
VAKKSSEGVDADVESRTDAKPAVSWSAMLDRSVRMGTDLRFWKRLSVAWSDDEASCWDLGLLRLLCVMMSG